MQALQPLFQGFSSIVSPASGGAGVGTPIVAEGPPLYGPGRYPWDEKIDRPTPPIGEPGFNDQQYLDLLRFIQGV